MILDCFTFFNELELLECRLEYLYDKVDWFVIVETDHMHSGRPKPLNYLANIKRYQKYSDKILYMPFAADVSSLDFSYKPTFTDASSAHWRLENFQRNYIANALALFPEDTTVIISDLDEIPSHHAIDLSKDILGKSSDVFGLVQDLFYYNFNQKQSFPWVASVITTAGTAKKYSPQQLRARALSGNIPLIHQGGWHLSYWGGVDRIQTKITNFAHQELNLPEFTDPEKIKSRIENMQDPYDRGKLVSVDWNSIPKDIRDIFGKFDLRPEQTKSEPLKKLDHFWHTIPGFFQSQDIDFLKFIIDQFDGNNHFVEIGSFKGRSSSFIAVEISNRNIPVTFDCIDTWEGSPEHQQGGFFADPDVLASRLYETFTRNMEPVKGLYNSKRMTSIEASKTYQDRSLDWVFIDADHSYESVKSDIMAWLPKMKSGGILSGHDYLHQPVRQAIEECLGKSTSMGNCWYYKVT